MSEYHRLKAQYNEYRRQEEMKILEFHLPQIADTLYALIQEYEASATFDDALRLAHSKVLKYEPVKFKAR